MLIPAHIEKDLKSVSISGRMAMATTCFEGIVKTLNLSSPDVDELVDIFWQFVEKNLLSEWESNVLDKAGIVCDYIEGSAPLPAESEFRRLPQFLLQMVSDIVDLGRADMYGAVTGYSQETCGFTLKVLNLALEHGFSISPVEPFLRSHITEFHGWGTASPGLFSSKAINSPCC
jgi:hypothetical protein